MSDGYAYQQAILSAVDVANINLLKYADRQGNDSLRTLGSAVGGGEYWSFSRLQEKRGSAVTNTDWNALSTIGTALTGYFLWGEKLTSTQIGGIILAAIGITLIHKE
jgi:drug/metabolite transporter (DMT)-like permease